MYQGYDAYLRATRETGFAAYKEWSVFIEAEKVAWPMEGRQMTADAAQAEWA